MKPLYTEAEQRAILAVMRDALSLTQLAVMSCDLRKAVGVTHG